MSILAKKDIVENIPCTKQRLFYFWDEEHKTSLYIFLCSFLCLLLFLVVLCCCCCYQRRKAASKAPCRDPWYKCLKLKEKNREQCLRPKDVKKSRYPCSKKKSDYQCLPDCPSRCSIPKKVRRNMSETNKGALLSHKDSLTLHRDIQCYTQLTESKESVVKFEKESKKEKEENLEKRKHKRCLAKLRDREKSKEKNSKSSEKSVVLTLKVGLPKHAYLKEPRESKEHFATPLDLPNKQYVLTDTTTGESTDEFKKYYDEMKRRKKEKITNQNTTKDTEHSKTHLEAQTPDQHTNTYYHYTPETAGKLPNYSTNQDKFVEQPFAYGVQVNDIVQNQKYIANEEEMRNQSRMQNNITSLTDKNKMADMSKPTYRAYQAVPERLLQSTNTGPKPETTQLFPNSAPVYLGNDSIEMLNELKNMDQDNTPEKDSMDILQELLYDPPTHTY